MNNTFDINRFGKVLKKDIRSYFPNYGITLLTFAAIPVGIWIIGTIFGGTIDPMARWLVLSLLFYICCMFAPERLYGKANLHREGTEFAMLPASSLEKFLSMLINCLIITPLLFLAGSFLIDSILALLPFGSYKASLFFISNTILTGMNEIIGPFSVLKNSCIYMIIISFVFLVGRYMFGNMIFDKHKTIKVIGIVIVGSFVIQTIASIIMIGSTDSLMEFSQQYADMPAPEAQIAMMKLFHNSFLISNIASTILAIACYVGTYLKIKTQKY